MRLAGFSVCLFLTVAGCEQQAPHAPASMVVNFPTSRFVLPNGLEVFVQEDHRTPRVAVNLRIHAGAKDDPPGRAGLAHLVEHLQFAQSEHTRPDSFFPTLLDFGAEGINGMTSNDATSYVETVPRAALEPMLWLEADRLASARNGWDDAMIEREKNIVAQELRWRWRNEPNGLKWQLLARAIYPEGHPYRRALDEEEQERASTKAELRDFAAKYYTPDNMTLMLVGDVTADDAKTLVTRHFSALVPCNACRAERPVPPVTRAALKVLRVVADVEDPIIYAGWPCPAANHDGSRDCELAVFELSGYVSAYTGVNDTRAQTMRTYSVHADHAPGRLGTLIAIEGVPTKGGKPEDLLSAIETMRRRIVAHEWADVGDYHTSLVIRTMRAVEALGNRAEQMQDYVELYGQADYVVNDMNADLAVTKDRMLAAMDKYLDPDLAALVIVTPDPHAPRAGKIVEEVRR